MNRTLELPQSFTFGCTVFAALFAWTACMGGLGWWYVHDHEASLREMARIYARACHEKDLIYRHRAGRFGTECLTAFKGNAAALAEAEDPLSGYLSMAATEHEGVQAHATSLNPLNPENAADAWETQALHAFSHGETEASLILGERGHHTARLMRPLFVEDTCLQCHAGQGYKVGDLRGGITVTVPVDSIWATDAQGPRRVYGVLTAIWALGSLTILLAGSFLRQRRREREQAVAVLSQFSAIVNSSQDAILGVSLDEIVTSWNPGAEQLYGYKAEDIIGRPVATFVPSDRLDEVKTHLARVQGGGKFVHYESVRRRKDGSLVDVSVTLSPIRSANGETVATAATIRDITDRKRAEEHLRQSEEKYRSLAKASPDSVVMSDLNGRVLYASPRVASLLKLADAKELCGRSIFECVVEADRQRMAEKLADVLQKGELRDIDFTVLRLDGSTVPVEVSAAVIRDAEGRPKAVMGIVRDVTERKQAERELAEKKQMAETASRAKSAFLANMSHELRTPMTAILGFADILLDTVKDVEAIERIQIIQRNGSNLLNLINDILDLSKIEAGKQQVVLEPCSPSKIAGDVIDTMRVRADAKGLLLSSASSGLIPDSIQADPVRLRQILMNLVANAIKFTEVGGVHVVTKVVRGAQGDAQLAFEVSDTGIGISREQMRLLFQPFTQVDASAARRFGGSGLGLAISKRLAEMLGGTILVESTPGRGSMFCLTIAMGERTAPPAVANPTVAGGSDRPPPAAAPRSRPPQIPNFLGCRILLAEDGPDNQRLVGFLLRKAGTEVTFAENGQVAKDLALAAEQSGSPFDIILMDMQMPVMDGYEATQRLRAAGSRAPIIALTAHAMPGDREKCLDAGCNDYLTKPIDRQLLYEMVHRWRAKTLAPE